MKNQLDFFHSEFQDLRLCCEVLLFFRLSRALLSGRFSFCFKPARRLLANVKKNFYVRASLFFILASFSRSLSAKQGKLGRVLFRHENVLMAFGAMKLI
jgi:hypothetical protein